MNNDEAPQLVYENNIRSTNRLSTSQPTSIPYYSLYSDRLVIHPRPFAPVLGRKRNSISDANLKKKKFTGKISKAQQSLVKKKLTAWLSSIQSFNNLKTNKYKKKKHYPVFITLTLSAAQKHSDKEIKRKLLDLMIKKMKSNFGVDKYFWKAERQDNGNIHFHLIVDKYCAYSELLALWNQSQNVLNYIDEFEKKHNHRNPNSVDVRSAESVDNFVNYVLKYCLKNPDGKPIEGRVFGMSDELRKLGVYQSELDSNLNSELVNSLAEGELIAYYHDYATTLVFKENFYGSKLYNMLSKMSDNYYLKVYNDLYSGKSKSTGIKKPFLERLVSHPIQLSAFKFDEQYSPEVSFNYVRKRHKNVQHRLT